MLLGWGCRWFFRLRDLVFFYPYKIDFRSAKKTALRWPFGGRFYTFSTPEGHFALVCMPVFF